MLGEAVSVIPPKEKETVQVNTGVRLPKDLLDRFQEIADAEGYSRNEVMVFFLKWALGAYEAEKTEETKKGKRGH